ncbi:hypothetical protein ANCCAN_14014 [Ancylostoma caninum]|uniref:Uncharacterized protein n=1 Tax=Ancylostoma caninum TaxID=29170 RepID=A0A368G9V3_ANCCA|nr:hypothetical protein ANCCAN_14014 [Ancylostoma caninum]
MRRPHPSRQLPRTALIILTQMPKGDDLPLLENVCFAARCAIRGSRIRTLYSVPAYPRTSSVSPALGTRSKNSAQDKICTAHPERNARWSAALCRGHSCKVRLPPY